MTARTSVLAHGRLFWMLNENVHKKAQRKRSVGLMFVQMELR